MTTTAPRSRGRPRDPGLDDTVLRATADLLVEHGYARLRVADVADRAGVGLGAVYRRWSGKRQLVLAALGRAVPDRAVPVTDDPAADVLTGLRAIRDAVRDPLRTLLTGLLSEMNTDPEFAAAVRETIITPVRVAQRERVRRLVGDVADLDVRADLGPAYVLLHGVFLGRAVSDDELRALLGVLAPTGRGA